MPEGTPNIAGQVKDFDPLEYMDRKSVRKTDRFAQLAVAAATQAVKDSDLDVAADEPTPDGKVSVEHVECNAACDFAPVVMVNWEFFDNQTPESAKRLVDDLRDDAPVRPTRGPNSVCTFREASRVLAGFPDGRASEGVQAGPATLAGLELAKQRGDDAPPMSSTQTTSARGATSKDA